MKKQFRISELEAMRRTIRFFETILHASADGILITDANQNIILVNESFSKILGKPRQDIIETDLSIWLEEFEGNALLHWSNLEQRIHVGEKYDDIDFRIRTKDGIKYLNVNASSLEQVAKEETGVIISLWRDVTKRKQAEEALRQSNERFAAVMDSLEASVYVADMETYEVLFANKYMKNLFGKDMVGKICWKTIQNGKSGPCEFCTNDRLLDANGEATEGYVWQFQNTVTNCWYEIRDQAIRWIDGRLVRMEIAIEITERKRAEEELKKKNEELKIFNRLSVDRELKMIELKKEINTLLEESGKGPRYSVAK